MRGFLVAVLLLPLIVLAQTPNELYICSSTEEIKLDGVLDEPVWQTAYRAKDFHQSKPYDTALAITKTEVMVAYDEHHIHVAAICYKRHPEQDYVVRSLRRDFSFPRNDAFQFIFDPYGDLTNGFSFGVNALGAQREGLLVYGGNFGVTTSWDIKWYSKVKQYPDKWVVEMAIPFKSIRFKPGESNWKVNFARNDLKNNEMSTWSKVPRNFNVASLTYCGELYSAKPFEKTGTNISLIPYVAGNVHRDYTDTLGTLSKLSAGLSAKIAVTSSLNLDLTVNPDFSQVEVDQQVTNLSRFTIFYPEKRAFFLENSDLFGQLGFRNIRPFFSRQIGIGLNKILGISQPQQILGGARLSGKVNKDWRIGALTMVTPRDQKLSEPIQNYSMAVVQRQVLTNSSLSFFVVNKQAFGTDSTNDVFYHPTDFNRVVGTDFKFTSKNSKFKGIAFVHQSIDHINPGRQGANASFLMYSDENWQLAWNHEYVGRNYNAEVGYVKRRGIYRLEPSIAHTWYPKTKKIISRTLSLYHDSYFADSLTWIDGLTSLRLDHTFKNTNSLSVSGTELYTLLRFDFDPTGSDSTKLQTGTSYHYRRFNIDYASDSRRRLNYAAGGQYGTYFNGTRLRYYGSLTYRAQPWGTFSLNFEQNEIQLPDSFADASWSLFGPKIQFSFTKSLFLNLYVQYNAQANNVNINTRFRWRFAPMSDLYIVYTDNYLAQSSLTPINDLYFRVQGKKNRTLVIKLVYWFSV